MTLASHQLRTPLSIIRGYVSMAEEGLLGELPKPLAQALPVVSGRAAEMEELVGDILLATELEAGGAELSRERIDLREMLTDVADAVRRTHPAARLRLRTARDPILISADRERLARAVTAMLEAAADLAPEGAEVVAGVRRDGDLVRADATAPAPDATPEDDVEPLFVPFSAAAGPRAGLGLHIARELARRHGGELVARPATGRITVVLRLPQA
jgi:signal transduction histidine kinase